MNYKCFSFLLKMKLEVVKIDLKLDSLHYRKVSTVYETQWEYSLKIVFQFSGGKAQTLFTLFSLKT